MNISEVRTARLRLVAMTPALLVVQERSAEELGRLLGVRVAVGWPGEDWTPEVYAFVRRQWEECPHTVGWHRYVVLAGPEPVMMGGLGAHPKDAAVAEFGYGILPAWQGRGYATEAARAMIAFLFGEGMERVCAQTYPAHEASLRVMERCGMRYAGEGFEEGCVLYEMDRARFTRVSGAAHLAKPSTLPT